jgi:hypothetical protein
MKTVQLAAAPYALGLAVAAAIAVGCSGSPASLSPSAQQNGPRYPRPLATTVSTKVQVDNTFTSTIYPSGGSAMCWTVSPTPLPSVAPNASSAPITLTYDTTCTSTSELAIDYGPISPVNEDCIFTTSYNGTAFVYSVTQSDQTDCKAYPSPTSLVNEIFQYGQEGSFSRKPALTRPHLP